MGVLPIGLTVTVFRGFSVLKKARLMLIACSGLALFGCQDIKDIRQELSSLRSEITETKQKLDREVFSNGRFTMVNGYMSLVASGAATEKGSARVTMLLDTKTGAVWGFIKQATGEVVFDELAANTDNTKFILDISKMDKLEMPVTTIVRSHNVVLPGQELYDSQREFEQWQARKKFQEEINGSSKKDN